MLKMSQIDKTSEPKYPKNDSIGTPRKRGSIAVPAIRLEPTNRPAITIAIATRLIMRERCASGASEPSTSMFIFSWPRVSILSASPEYDAASSVPRPDEYIARARSSSASRISSRVPFLPLMWAFMIATIFWLGI